MATVSVTGVVPIVDVSQIPGSSVSTYNTNGKHWTMTGAQVAAGTGGKAGYFDWQCNTATVGIPLGSIITAITSNISAFAWQSASAALSADIYASCQLGNILTTQAIGEDPSSTSLSVSKGGSLVLNSHLSAFSLLSATIWPNETFYATDIYIDPGTLNFTITYTPPAVGNTFFGRGF